MAFDSLEHAAEGRLRALEDLPSTWCQLDQRGAAVSRIRDLARVPALDQHAAAEDRRVGRKTEPPRELGRSQGGFSAEHAVDRILLRSDPGTTVQSMQTTVGSSRLALTAGVAGLLAVATYTVIVSAPLGDVVAPVIASLFGPLLAGASVALYLVLATERATLAGLLAAIANVAAGALVTAMLLVQLAVDDAEERSPKLSPSVEDAFDRVEFGLDLSWDTFISAGTILFGCAMLAHPRFGRWFGLSGIGIGVALYALNFASFPTPPSDSGLVDLGPLVGLWYAVVSVRTLRLRRVIAHSGRQARSIGPT
jgi:hypothetical protein